MNLTTPALVTQRGARRLPRLALLVFCGAYVLPGVLGRDPWRNADLVAFAQMLSMAEGRTAWLAPALGGVSVGDAAVLPHWLGAAFIALLWPLIDGAIAARLPFALLLAATLTLTWYATFHLARTDNAQPVPFAFGGEAEPVDYARAIADGAVLALIATLGLLQLGHETTPELAQLFSVSLFLYALSAAPFRNAAPRCAVVLALLMLAGSGAPAIAVAIGIAGAVVCWRSAYDQVRHFAAWVGAATVAAALLATALDAWRWRGAAMDAAGWIDIGRQWLWFLWPTWPLVLWTLWRWRQHVLHRHIAVPLVLVGVALGANVLMGGSDRALMLGVPGMAALAAFALPTFKRSTAAAIDWFSMFFFSGCAITVWVIYIAMQTGAPAQFARNAARVLPGFVARFNWVELLLAMVATLAWLWLVRWRTGRHREAVWKSMVLPAGGVALCWLLGMTLWLPPLDYARSSRVLVERIAVHVPRTHCISAPTQSPVQVAALEVFGGYRVEAGPRSEKTKCEYLLANLIANSPENVRVSLPALPGWQFVTSVRGPRDREETTAIYRRAQ